MPDQKTMRTRCLGGFSVMWVTTLLISPVKKGCFAQKRPNLARNWHFWPLLAHLVPCWWVGWWLWRAGCISQDTYLLYKYIFSGSCLINVFSVVTVWSDYHSRVLWATICCNTANNCLMEKLPGTLPPSGVATEAEKSKSETKSSWFFLRPLFQDSFL